MSLINQMLQDLEERRSGAELTGVPGQLRATPIRRRTHPAWWWAVALLIVVLTALASWFIGRQTAPSQRAVPPLALKLEQRLGPAQPTVLEIAIPEAQPIPGLAEDAAPNAKLDATIDSEPHAASPSFAGTGAVSAPLPATDSPARSADMTLTKPVAAAVGAPPTPSVQSSVTSTLPSAVPTKAAALAPTAVKIKSTVPVGDNEQSGDSGMPANVSKQIKELTPQQRADNEYRRATVVAQQGKIAEAIGGLERALALDSRHAAARQTLVGLLLESRRQDEAVRILQEGLTLDRAQPGLAMLLARLQIEQGDLRPAIDTLQRSLPYAADRADYHAFLAALFQRDGRHKDTVETYLIALRKSPQNGIWWMGMGISLQAENRLAEARDAFFRAKATNTLAPDLTAFVEQKLIQLR